MKRLLNLLLLAVVTLVGTNVNAQDPHFSQFNAAPLYLNPAMTGVFSGNYRVTAIYRSQWGSILKNEDGTKMFRTIGASYDMRFGLPGTKHDAIGGGLSFFSDQAGASQFGTNHISLSLSYIKALNRKGNQFLTAGFQASYAIRGINYNNLRFGDMFDGTEFNQVLTQENPGNFDNFSFVDLSAGIFWYFVHKKRTNYWAGVSVSHLNRPNQSFFDGGNEKLFMKITGSLGLQAPLGNQIDILPSILVMSQGPAFETSIGTYVKILFEPNRPQGNAFYIGPWYRIVRGVETKIASDALVLATRFDFSSFSVGFSYDLNFSELTEATNTRGAFEVSAVHVGAFKQKSKVKYCPRF